jgi:hypothetical protein
MCLSALYFMNLRGEVLMERQYRDDVTCVPPPAPICSGLVYSAPDVWKGHQGSPPVILFSRGEG